MQEAREALAIHPFPHPFPRARVQNCVRVAWHSIAAWVTHCPLPSRGVQYMRNSTAFPLHVPDLSGCAQAHGRIEQEPGALIKPLTCGHQTRLRNTTTPMAIKTRAVMRLPCCSSQSPFT